ncbi:hypothetical protein LXL04_034736 [Taraxacum kok-saghyz]
MLLPQLCASRPTHSSYLRQGVDDDVDDDRLLMFEVPSCFTGSRVQNGRIKQKLSNWSFNNVIKLNLDYQRSL